VDAFHIDRAECIGADNTIRHRAEDGRIVVHNNFLRAGPMTIGLTSGASTPDRYFALLRL
jgi:4-hydroxy-3-methylbut-2-enyl diphosphate reductase